MDPETLARAVEPFFTTKPRGSGTGLGLSMAKGFAEQSGGGLAIDSEPGVGTTVTLWLPAGDDASEGAAGSAGTVTAAATPSRRVLLVDDEEMVRESLAAGLMDAGFGVLVAGSGAEALALLDAGEQVDMLVTDFSMPGMDGKELIRHAQARSPRLPAVILTGYVNIGEPNPAVAGLRGVLAVLRKPIHAARLAEHLETMIAREEAGGH
jgi:CheY-like chemotaxis protein